MFTSCVIFFHSSEMVSFGTFYWNCRNFSLLQIWYNSFDAKYLCFLFVTPRCVKALMLRHSHTQRLEFPSWNLQPPTSKCSRCMTTDMIQKHGWLWQTDVSLECGLSAVQHPCIWNRGKTTRGDRRHYKLYFMALLYLETYLNVPLTVLIQKL